MSRLLEAESLSVAYEVGAGSWRRQRRVLAVDGVSFSVEAGRALGVVGESGCGKSSLARALLGLESLVSGVVRLDGQVLPPAGTQAWRAHRRSLQLVFQDPIASLDPRMRVGASIAEPLLNLEPTVDAAARRDRVAGLLGAVGLERGLATRYPHELSGGQCQRVAIARSIAVGPRVLVCDEPVSALDVSVQGQVVNLLTDLQRRLGLALVFISHDLALVRHVADEVLVLYRGRTLELAPAGSLFAAPLHPYTRRLLDSASGHRGKPPASAAAWVEAPDGLVAAGPRGCAFAPRCPWATARCRDEVPALVPAGRERAVACHRWTEWSNGLAPPS